MDNRPASGRLLRITDGGEFYFGTSGEFSPGTDTYYRKPPPLVERRLRLEVSERVDARGRVLTPLDAGHVERAVAAVRAAGVSPWRSVCCTPTPIPSTSSR